VYLRQVALENEEATKKRMAAWVTYSSPFVPGYFPNFATRYLHCLLRVYEAIAPSHFFSLSPIHPCMVTLFVKMPWLASAWLLCHLTLAAS
jgi:hypothetical protein